MNDVLLSPLRLSELESLIEKSVLRALSKAPAATPLLTSTNFPRIGNKKHIISITGWPDGTFYQKVGEMPEGVVIRGKSKRLLFDMEKFMVWLKTPVQP